MAITIIIIKLFIIVITAVTIIIFNFDLFIIKMDYCYY